MIKLYSTLLLLSLGTIASHAANITAITNGNWSTGSTWSTGTVPDDGDIVTIPAGKTVFFSGTPYSSSTPSARPTIKLAIYGTLDFSDPGNDKLYLDYGSEIQVYNGGKISTSGSSPEIIAIYSGTGITDNPVWDGTPSVVDGPTYATATSSKFAIGVLPLNFLSFKAETENETIKLFWTTAQEENVAQFIIERFNNKTWEGIGSISAQNKLTINAYVFVDKNPLLQLTNYRLKEIDKDGKTFYSSIIAAKAGSSKNLLISYNKNNQTIQVNTKTTGINLMLTVYDFNGRRIASQKLFNNSSIVPFSAPNGCYVISVTNGNNTALVTQKLLVQ